MTNPIKHLHERLKPENYHSGGLVGQCWEVAQQVKNILESEGTQNLSIKTVFPPIGTLVQLVPLGIKVHYHAFVEFACNYGILDPILSPEPVSVEDYYLQMFGNNRVNLKVFTDITEKQLEGLLIINSD